MTLVVGACFPDAVLMAGDSRVAYADRITQQVTGHGEDQKLFVRNKVAIATFGESATLNVPEVFRDGLGADVTLEEAIAFVKTRFAGEPGLGAYVGGVTANGPQLVRINIGSDACDPLPSEHAGHRIIWFDGPHAMTAGPGNIALDPPADLAAVATRMCAEFHRQAGDYIGPPYKFVELRLGQSMEWPPLL